jgi:hypothetical protein
MKFFLALLLFPFVLYSHPFQYDLHLTKIEGKSPRVMVIFHGMGGNWEIINLINQSAGLEQTLVSFNFPDHCCKEGMRDPSQTTFGTINELLPALYVLKTVVIDENRDQIDLYGYSAGGGALVNTLGVLNTMTYDQELASIGIDQKGKERILQAIQNGDIILDTPLKSVEEIIAMRGPKPDLVVVEERYRENDMEPIHSLAKLKGLKVNVLIHFQNPDRILSNRDDQLYIELFKKFNRGPTAFIIAFDSGHHLPHPTLWQFYHDVFQKDAAFLWKRFDSYKAQPLFQGA